jgi:hypothetical protein
MAKLFDALKHKVTTHTLAVLLGVAAAALASYAETGQIDAQGVLRALAPLFTSAAPAPQDAPAAADAGPSP